MILISFADPETILKEEYGKTPCKRYMTVGECAFGLGCRFSHYTPSMMWELEQLGFRFVSCHCRLPAPITAAIIAWTFG
jgi:hypothetical protein